MPLALFSLFLAAFCIGTTELVIAGLLPEIAADLNVSVPDAGLLVTGYAISVAVGGPIISLLTSRFPRKVMIMVLMAIFLGGHVFGALATSYPMLMAARIVISLSHGSFFGIAAILAVTLVPPARAGSALALVFAGLSVSNIVGVPLGTLIGHAWGWRATFWIVGGLGVLTTIAMALFVPANAAPQRHGARLAEQFHVLAKPQVYMTYGIIIAMMIGFFAFFTYVVPYLVAVGGVAESYVPALLLVFGLGATVGIFAGGRLNDWNTRATLLGAFAAQAAVFLGLLLAGSNWLALAVLVFALGMSNLIPNTALQTRILRGAAAAPDLASTLISSVFNIGIAIGALLGAMALNQGMAYGHLPWFGFAGSAAALLLVGLALFWIEQRPAEALTA